MDDPSADIACYGLEGLASSWIAQRVLIVEATTLLAAAATSRARLGTRPLGDEHDLVEHGTAEARRLLGAKRYAEAVAAGSTMPIDEAVQYALEVE